ncbi:hypothetical protein CNMCM5623_002477 [Aspergillus felis]|uniref:Uncharacterized protein n=1 Tax=Aspergillus felis TaxID=1287682 RepID=A0A8H6QDB0_9EURO|nr:hypothetical protein CNMCM5623_002477 [Aspergillus felis]
MQGFSRVPPSIIEQWAAEPAADKEAKQLDFVLSAEDPWPPVSGTSAARLRMAPDVWRLRKGPGPDACPSTWTVEVSRANLYEASNMQAAEEGIYEMVLHQGNAVHSCINNKGKLTLRGSGGNWWGTVSSG